MCKNSDIFFFYEFDYVKNFTMYFPKNNLRYIINKIDSNKRRKTNKSLLNGKFKKYKTNNSTKHRFY
jgi:hypothetical protein